MHTGDIRTIRRKIDWDMLNLYEYEENKSDQCYRHQGPGGEQWWRETGLDMLADLRQHDSLDGWFVSTVGPLRHEPDADEIDWHGFDREYRLAKMSPPIHIDSCGLDLQKFGGKYKIDITLLQSRWLEEAIDYFEEHVPEDVESIRTLDIDDIRSDAVIHADTVLESQLEPELESDDEPDSRCNATSYDTWTITDRNGKQNKLVIATHERCCCSTCGIEQAELDEVDGELLFTIEPDDASWHGPWGSISEILGRFVRQSFGLRQ